MSTDAGCNLLHLLGSEGQVGIGEAHVGFTLHGHEVDVGMGHFKSQHTLTDLDARNSLADSESYTLGKDLQTGEFFVREVKDIINLALGDDEGVPFLEGTDVKEGEVAFVLGNLIAGNLACHDA